MLVASVCHYHAGNSNIATITCIFFLVLQLIIITDKDTKIVDGMSSVAV